jgi:hypothetical protein
VECTVRLGEVGDTYKILIEYLNGRAFGRPRRGSNYEITV